MGADSVWVDKDRLCGADYVTIKTNGELDCKSCAAGPSGFLVEYGEARESGTGVKHGKCCINSHHKVCEQLKNGYKIVRVRMRQIKHNNVLKVISNKILLH